MLRILQILGLGDVVLKDKERIQPRAGRLDLLLQDTESNHRYEVEVQLGRTDESHIIRTIEYWDIERKRYPQYEHTAVIVAEEITARFLNVISLFNGTIPLMAIQMSAVQLADTVSLLFTTVLDEARFGLVDEDEEVQEVTDRAYWEARGSKATVAMADEVLKLVAEFAPGLELEVQQVLYWTCHEWSTKQLRTVPCSEECLESGDSLAAIPGDGSHDRSLWFGCDGLRQAMGTLSPQARERGGG